MLSTFNNKLLYTILFVAGFILIIGFIMGFIEKSKIVLFPPSSGLASVLIVLDSDVSVKQSGDSNFTLITESVEIKAGDEIQTSDFGRAALLYPNGTLTTLNEGTRLTVKTLQENGNSSRLALSAGSIWSRIKKLLKDDESYEVETQGIVTSVRGTEFEVEVKGNVSTITVLNSIVTLTAIDSETGIKLEDMVVKVASGEKITLGAQEILTSEPSQERMTPEEIKAKILAHSEVEQELNTSEVQKKLQIARGGTPIEKGITPDNPLYVLERISEAIGTFMVFDNNKKAQRYLYLASERLAEAEFIVSEGNKGIDKALERYEEMFIKAEKISERFENLETQKLMALKTLEHLNILERISKEAPEESRAFVEKTKTFPRQGYIKALQAISSKNPSEALTLSLEAMNERLREIQIDAAQGNSLDMFNKMQDYNRLLQLAGDFQGDDAQLLEYYSIEVGKAVRNIEMINTISQKLPPGIVRTVREIKNRSINSQLVSLGDLAIQKPEKAVKIFAKEAEYYISNINKGVLIGDDKRAEQNIEAYQKYITFGNEVSKLARDIGPGKESLHDLVEKATSHHGSVLESLQSQVSPQVEEGIKRAIENLKRIKAVEVVKTIKPEEFRSSRSIKKPRGELPSPTPTPTLPTTPVVPSTKKPDKVTPTPKPTSSDKSEVITPTILTTPVSQSPSHSPESPNEVTPTPKPTSSDTSKAITPTPSVTPIVPSTKKPDKVLQL